MQNDKKNSDPNRQLVKPYALLNATEKKVSF